MVFIFSDNPRVSISGISFVGNPMSLHDIWLGDVIPESGVDISIGVNSFDPPSPPVPLYSAHARQIVFHDGAQSGILAFNSSKNTLFLILSNSGVRQLSGAVYFDAYDATGGQTTGSSAITLNIDTERSNSHSNIFVLTNDELQINASGTYEFSFFYTCLSPGGGRVSHTGFMQRQAPGGSYTDIPGTIAYQYARTSDTADTGHKTFILDNIAPGDKFRIRVQQTAITVASVNTVANASSLTIRKII